MLRRTRVKSRRQVPPRHLSYLFVAITLTLATALVWQGVQLLRQDRALEAQRVRDDLQRVAVTAAEDLSRRIEVVEADLDRIVTLPQSARREALSAWGSRIGTGAVVVDGSGTGLHAAPAGTLLFDPSLTGLPRELSTVFLQPESLEFRAIDLAGAERAYRGLSRSRDATVRGDALLGLGRVLRKERKLEEALQVFRRLADVDLEFDGVPAALLAGHAGLLILEDLKRAAEARKQADMLATRLKRGDFRGHLTRSAFEFYVNEVSARSNTEEIAPREEMALSRAVDSIYQSWPVAERGRALLSVDSTPVLAIWRSTPSVRVAFIATNAHVTREWLSPLDSVLRRENASLALRDASGHWTTVPPREPNALRVTRSESETGLPWLVSIQSRDPSSRSADLAARRQILFTSLVITLLLVLVGTYAVARAVNRELAVARMQSDFVAAVSHEFRTPLTSLRQVTELLAEGRVTNDGRRQEYHDILQRETGRLHRLVENLLDFGRFEAGAHEFRFERVTPHALAEPLVNEFREEMSPRGFEVVFSHEETDDVSADRGAMMLALRNLLDNAVKYSGGEHRIDVTVSQPNGRVALSVRDHGIGIPPDERKAIFERFTRGRGVRTSGIPGSGIGLAMVDHIVREHGGEIRVSSIVGEGSTFTILLAPLAE